MIPLVNPEVETIIEFVHSESFVIELCQERTANGSKETLYFPPGRRIVRFGMNQSHTQSSASESQQLRGKSGAIVTIEYAWQVVTLESQFESRNHDLGILMGVKTAQGQES